MNLTIKDITRISLLATILYVVQFMGSWILYVEFVNFIILLYGIYLPRKDAYLAVFLFTCLVLITRGVALWSIMYVVVFPQYALIYSLIKKRVTSEYSLALIGAFFSFCCGTLIDLPFILITGDFGHGLWIRLLLGFQVSLGNAVCTYLASIYLLKRLGNVLQQGYRYS